MVYDEADPSMSLLLQACFIFKNNIETLAYIPDTKLDVCIMPLKQGNGLYLHVCAHITQELLQNLLFEGFFRSRSY